MMEVHKISAVGWKERFKPYLGAHTTTDTVLARGVGVCGKRLEMTSSSLPVVHVSEVWRHDRGSGAQQPDVFP